MASIPVVKMTAADAGEPCPVCKEGIELNAPIRRLPCKRPTLLAPSHRVDVLLDHVTDHHQTYDPFAHFPHCPVLNGGLRPAGTHFFCEDCIAPWLQLHATCPVCRFSMVEEDAEIEDASEV